MTRHTIYLMRLTALFITISISMPLSMAENSADGTLRETATAVEQVSEIQPNSSILMNGMNLIHNFSRGTTTVSIPLMRYETSDLAVDIIISNMTGAIQIDKDPEGVGLSWELDTGGIVSRTIVGMPDEHVTFVKPESLVPNLNNLTEITAKRLENNHDRYFFKSGSLSGQFIIDGDDIKQMPANDAIIQKYTDNTFCITDANGVKYIYDAAEKLSCHHSHIQLLPWEPLPNYNGAVCKWRLKRIINSTCTDSIEYTYQTLPNKVKTRGGATMSASVMQTTSNIEESIPSLDYTQTIITYTHSDRLALSRISGREIPRVSNAMTSFTTTTYFFGPIRCEGNTLKRIDTATGYAGFSIIRGKPYYYIDDFQGNIRQVIDYRSLYLLQENHFYPFGMLMGESSGLDNGVQNLTGSGTAGVISYNGNSVTNNPYKYGGKELITSFGLNYIIFPARLLDPSTISSWAQQLELREVMLPQIRPVHKIQNDAISFAIKNGITCEDGVFLVQLEDDHQRLRFIITLIDIPQIPHIPNISGYYKYNDYIFLMHNSINRFIRLKDGSLLEVHENDNPIKKSWRWSYLLWGGELFIEEYPIEIN